MKLFLLLFFILLGGPAINAALEADLQDLPSLRRPPLSQRCLDLLDQRKKTIELKQRYATLASRANKLLEVTPENKEKAKRQFTDSLSKLQKKEMSLKKRISNLDENLIRKGCPSTNL